MEIMMNDTKAIELCGSNAKINFPISPLV